MEKIFEIVDYMDERKARIMEIQSQIREAEDDLKKYLVETNRAEFLKVDYNFIARVKRQHERH